MTTVRRLQRRQIVQRLKAKGIRQWDIAQRANVSTSFVNDVIARRKPKDNEKAAEVWRVLEEVLNGQ